MSVSSVSNIGEQETGHLTLIVLVWVLITWLVSVVVMIMLLQAQAVSTTCLPAIAADDGQLGEVKDLV